MINNFLQSGLVGNIHFNQVAEERKKISEAWDKLGFTENLTGVLKENISLLYENTARNLIQEATDASNSGSFVTVVFPLIRRVFSKLLANDIVSIQALNLPIGKLFYIKPVTSEREWEGLDGDGKAQSGSSAKHTGLMGYERHDRNFQNPGKEGIYKDGGSLKPQGLYNNRYYLPDEVIVSDDIRKPVATWDDVHPVGHKFEGLPTDTANRHTPVVTRYMQTSLYDLFYDEFLYDHSKGRAWIKVAQTAAPVKLNQNRSFDYITDNKGIPSREDGSVRNVILEISGFNTYNAGLLIGPDGNEMDTETFLASLKIIAAKKLDTGAADGYTTFEQYENIPIRLLPQKYGKAIVERDNFCNAEGKMYVEVDLKKPTLEHGLTVDGYIGVDKDTEINDKTFFVTWVQYDSLELETEIGEVSFKIDSVTIAVEERKLRSTWSPEQAQDVAAFHNIDAEAELTSLLAQQVSVEIDREILRDLKTAAPWQLSWDFNGWRRTATTSTNYTQKDWNQELITKINQISAQINKTCLMGGANFIVVSPEISAVFDNLEYFHATNAAPGEEEYSLGMEKVGNLSGRYQVYVDPYSRHWTLLIGHKGKSMLDTGYIYAPYVPLQLTPTLYNPFNAAPVKFIMTRYAKKVVNNKFYGLVRVHGLTTWDTNELR
ncbi:MAG: hypothetical protein FWC41_01855 [Firmicutes bacterium]|nr:hypothetical protein [Bacillota bacterium]